MGDRDDRRDDDRRTVSRFQSGEREEALRVLFERYGPVTYAFFRRRVGAPDVAADLNQDLYLDVLAGLARFRGESSFQTWLFRLAHNRLSHLRRRWRVHLDERADSTPDELLDELTTTDVDPDREADRRRQTHALRACLARLSEIERAIVLGQYYAGATLEELTRRLGLTNPSGARAHLLSAQRHLRRCLEGRAGDRP